MGIIGMGKMGMIHADWINKNKNLKLIAVSKKSTERVEEIKNKYNVDVFTKNDDLLNRKDIDYVVVSATNEAHEELTINALNKNKNVIVEKPMSTNYKSTLRMIEAAKKNRKNLFVYQSQRWDKDFLFVKDTIDSGKLGRILIIEAKTLEYGEDWLGWGIHGLENPWISKKEYGGGMLMDWGPHLVDHILQLMGEDPIGVYGVLQSGTFCTEVDDQFSAIVKFDNNVVCKIEAYSSCRIPPPRWFVVGTKGTLMAKGTPTSTWDEVEINFIRDNGHKEIQNIKLLDHPGAGFSPGFYENFVQFVKGKKKKFVTMYEGSKVIKILDLIRKSSEENRFINF